MTKIVKILGVVAAFALLIAALVLATSKGNLDVLTPAGTIAGQQKNIIIFASLLSLVVIVPVFIMLFAFAYRYRETNTKARYEPNWSNNKWIEAIWFGIPLILITIVAVVTWQTSHSLDPFRPIASERKPVRVQVVAMDWKWLFIYPEYDIASVNYLAIPEQTPINFQITSEGAMNSFWIPRLGSQIYAMAGMSTQLHLQADSTGTFRGSAANINGDGFADMTFTAESMTLQDFDRWVQASKTDGTLLTDAVFEELSQPSTAHPVEIYKLARDDLYATVLANYMMPPKELQEFSGEGMGH